MVAVMGLFSLGLFTSNLANAESNPFTSNDLVTVVANDAESKCGEGKCGESKAKSKSSKCGEGKCGESK